MFASAVIQFLTMLGSRFSHQFPNKSCRQKIESQEFHCTLNFPNFNLSGLEHTCTQETFSDAHFHTKQFCSCGNVIKMQCSTLQTGLGFRISFPLNFCNLNCRLSLAIIFLTTDCDTITDAHIGTDCILCFLHGETWRICSP